MATKVTKISLFKNNFVRFQQFQNKIVFQDILSLFDFFDYLM